MLKLKPLPKFLLLAATLTGSLLEYRHLVRTGVIHQSFMKSVIPIKVDEVQATVLSSGAVAAKPLPSTNPIQPCADGNISNCLSGAVVVFETWAWNPNMSPIYANGGVATTKGSIAAALGTPITIKRQDDTNQMQADLLDTAQKLQSDPNATGVKFITIMGDGGAQFFAAIQPKLLKVCPDCGAKVIGEFGYSRGEDGFWGPVAWTNPQTGCEAMRGGVTIGVLRDGDWNIALKKLGQCDIPNNPDDKVYDPKAMNWIAADDYVKAANAFASGTACADLPTKGKIGGGTKRYCADAVVTWTPGDVTVAKKRGGVVPIMTTQQSVFQMPCVVIGIDQWMKTHRKETDDFLDGALQAADQLRSNPAALQRGGELSAKVYGEETGDYWVRYYKGVTEPDAQGIRVHLGGSAVNNLADNLQVFGLAGGPNLFAATYTTFGKIVVQQYPKLVPEFPSAASITDLSYLKDVQQRHAAAPAAPAEEVIHASVAPMHSIAGKRNYAIQFATGSDRVLAVSVPVLDQLAADISLTNYVVALHGHTDNTGQADANMELSQRRADAVKTYLTAKGVRNTIRSYAHGSEEPLPNGDPNSPAGRAKNRRVQVVLGE